jgi:hypothetical protein
VGAVAPPAAAGEAASDRVHLATSRLDLDFAPKNSPWVFGAPGGCQPRIRV